MQKINFTNLYKINQRDQNLIIKSFIKNLKLSNFIKGKEVSKFENSFSKINDSKYCISCANGSDAILIALKALGLKKGDEVITTCFSWIATSAAITSAGGKIIFCDIEKDSYSIDPEDIKKKITKRTVGIIPVHLYGIPANMENITRIAQKNKLWVVEDCAQAHLAEYNGKKVGNFGSFGTFSFFPGKNLGALGDAGCLVTNNKKLAYKARLIANHGGKGLHLIEGINSRLDTIQANFLNIKIKRLFEDTKKRILLSYQYNKLNKKYIKIPKYNKTDKIVYHQYVIRTKKRDLLKKYLEKFNIQTQVHYKKILPTMKAYKYLKLDKKNFSNAHKASKEILSLPISHDHTKEELRKVVNKVNYFFKINE